MDKIIFVSQAQMTWAEESQLCNPHKICVLEHAVDIEDLLEIPPPSYTENVVFGALGRMTQQKGFDILIDAWKKSEYNKNAKLLIGGAGPEEASLKAQATGIETIEFLGAVKNRREFYEKCACIIIPSRWEPYGQVCLEARAAARPVIVSDVDGLPEQVSNETCGFLFRSGDSSELAARIDQMQELARMSNQFKRMCLIVRASAAHTRQNFLTKFSKLLTQKANSSSC